VTEKARSSRSSNSSLFVGRLGRAVGLRGEIEVLIISDEPSRFAPGSVLFAGDRTLTVQQTRPQGTRTIVSFAEVTDRTEAEALKGTELVVPIENARPLESDEYWDHDLIGCTMVTVDGTQLGTVRDVLHQPANEVLVVEDGTKQLLIPLVSAVVKKVEPGLRITVDPPAGLLD
jgi:16S rRNA processing protein RimM